MPARQLPAPPAASSAAQDTRALWPYSWNDLAPAGGAQRSSTVAPCAASVRRRVPLPWMAARVTAAASVVHSRQAGTVLRSCVITKVAEHRHNEWLAC